MPLAQAAGAVGKSLEVPEIDEDPAAARRVRERGLDASLDVVEPGRVKLARVPQCLERAVARPCGYQRDDRCARRERQLDGTKKPPILLAPRDEWRRDQHER